MATKYDRFIIAGRQYEWLPGNWEQVSDFGVRKQTYPTLDLKNVTVIQQAQPNGGVEHRKIHRQAWRATWSQDSVMDSNMRDHIRLLYELQKDFWIQFDDEMLRPGAILEQLDGNNDTYFTPTFPIAPYGYEPELEGALNNYNGTIFVDDTAIYAGFAVNSELGMVTFDTPNEDTEIVQMAYTWKARVRIDSCDLVPYMRSQEIYTGSVVFVQTEPDYTDDPWYDDDDLPWNTSIEGDFGDAQLGDPEAIVPEYTPVEWEPPT